MQTAFATGARSGKEYSFSAAKMFSGRHSMRKERAHKRHFSLCAAIFLRNLIYLRFNNLEGGRTAAVAHQPSCLEIDCVVGAVSVISIML